MPRFEQIFLKTEIIGRTPWIGEPVRLQFIQSLTVGHGWSDLAHTHTNRLNAQILVVHLLYPFIITALSVQGKQNGHPEIVSGIAAYLKSHLLFFKKGILANKDGCGYQIIKAFLRSYSHLKCIHLFITFSFALTLAQHLYIQIRMLILFFYGQVVIPITFVKFFSIRVWAVGYERAEFTS